MELRHKNIVRVEDAGKTSNGFLYISMEYLPKGSLIDIYKRNVVLIKRAKKIVCDVCWGIQYAHDKGYIHRDIKLGNILISNNGIAKLSDFGLATRTINRDIASPAGYLTHLAPEVINHRITNKLTDIYALGVTAYRLVNGDAFLPSIRSDDELIDLICEGKYPDRNHYRPYIPSSIRSVINKAMHPDISRRFESASTFRRRLEGISIKCNWSWKPKKTSVIYTTNIKKSSIKVIVNKRQDNKYDIITTKKLKKGIKRHVLKDCFEGLVISSMKSELHRILSRYVTDGK